MNEGLGGLTLSFSFFSKVAIQTPLATCLARYEHSQSLSIFGAHAHNGQVARVSVDSSVDAGALARVLSVLG